MTDAVARFDWPLVRWLAMKPVVRLGYFGPFDWLWFRRFDSKAERIALGARSFEIANRIGWAEVEARLPQATGRAEAQPKRALQPIGP